MIAQNSTGEFAASSGQMQFDEFKASFFTVLPFFQRTLEREDEEAFNPLIWLLGFFFHMPDRRWESTRVYQFICLLFVI